MSCLHSVVVFRYFQVNKFILLTISVVFSLLSLIDCFLVDSSAVSLAMSPTGDFLASAHVDDLGIYLWYVLYIFLHRISDEE